MGGEMVAGAEELSVAVGELRVRLLRRPGLEQAVDAQRLLSCEDAGEPPYWMHLWPGARVLAAMMAEAPPCAGAGVVELGCGLALPSLVAAMRGARAVACDWKHEPLRLARESARRNGCTLDAVQLDWRAAGLKPIFDVCLAADVGYDRELEHALCRAVAGLLRNDGVAYLADSVNTYRGGIAEGLSAAGFGVHTREVRAHEDGRPLWVRVIEARRSKA